MFECVGREAVSPGRENGDVSDEIGGLRVVQGAFDRPTLKLLHGTYAAVQVAVLRTVFDSDRRSVTTEHLHVHVGALLEAFAETGVKVPPGTGREVCRRWMGAQWLQRVPGETGGEVYELTSHALEALELVQSLSKDRPLLSESRLAAIIEAIHRQATEASPDIESKVARLDADISRLTAERDRLLDGEIPAAPTDEAMLEGYVNLMDLIGQLPSDFKRVEEGVRDMRHRVLDDFRGDMRPHGQILDEYLARSDDLFGTPEGRAFEGALRLLRDQVLLAQVRADLDVILDHPFTTVLKDDEVREFRQTVQLVRRGLNDVMAQRSRVTRTLREHIESHDAIRERELSAVLRDLDEDLHTWMRRTKARSRCPVGLLPHPAETPLPKVVERFFDPEDHLPPEALPDDPEETPEPLTLEELRRLGGPQLSELLAGLTQPERVEAATVGAIFDSFPTDLRRPVEILGLMVLLSRAGLLDEAEDREPVETIRSDESTRSLVIPRVTLTLEHSAALERVEVG
jgi:hypothetical protein